MIIVLADDYLIGFWWVSVLFLHLSFLSEFFSALAVCYFFFWLARFFFHRELLFVLEPGVRGGQEGLVYGIYKRHPELAWRLQHVLFCNLGMILWTGT